MTINLLCIQEPCILQDGNVNGIPKYVVTFYSKTRWRSAVAVVNKSIPVMEVLTVNNIVAVSIDIGPEIKIVIVYLPLPPIEEVDAELYSLRDLLGKYEDKIVGLVRHFNAKSSL